MSENNITWGNISISRNSKTMFSDIMEENQQLKERTKKLEKENRSLKLNYAKCRDCKHANMYSPDFAFLVIDPKCELNIKTINSESDACEDFQLCGRGGR